MVALFNIIASESDPKANDIGNVTLKLNLAKLGTQVGIFKKLMMGG